MDSESLIETDESYMLLSIIESLCIRTQRALAVEVSVFL